MSIINLVIFLCDNAVIRETYRKESTWNGVRRSRTDWWDDPVHAGRHGRPRLVRGDAHAWVYTDFDGDGHDPLLVEQRVGATVPSGFLYIVSNELHDAFVTVRDFTPSAVYALAASGTATNEAWTVGGDSVEIVRSLDPQDRPDGLAMPSSGYSLRRAYADDGNVESVSNALAVVAYAYTPDRLDAGYTLTLSNGVTFTRDLARDGFRRSLVTGVASSVDGAAVESFAYVHDALGRPVTRNADAFGYNARGEVVAATVAGNVEAHEYDGIGNSTIAAFNGVTNVCTANNLNQYASIVCASASPCETVTDFDADGNMTQCGDWTYTCDAANRLTAVSSNGVLLVTNDYDAKGRRVRKVTPESTTTFFYDGWNLIEERVANTNGTVSTIHYYWGKDLSGTLQGAGGVGGLLYLTVDGSIYVPCCDGNGNVTRYLDANGTTVAQYTYDAFGRTISQTGPLAHVFRHRFSTKYFDAETGLYYYGYRFYSPVLRRWLTRDPIEEEGGLNLYGFCGNNAVCKYDKDGRAYFVYRPLDFGFARWTGIKLKGDYFKDRNHVFAHEQLIFEDGSSPVNIGYFNAPIDDNNPRQDEFHFQTQYVPIEGKGAYNDCVMREAVKNVRPHPYKLWTRAGRSTGQYNCQDYADDLRSEYYRLSLDLKIRCKCNLK